MDDFEKKTYKIFGSMLLMGIGILYLAQNDLVLMLGLLMALVGGFFVAMTFGNKFFGGVFTPFLKRQPI